MARIILKPWTLSQRLFLVSGLALVPAILIVIISYLSMSEESASNLNERARQTAELEAIQLERIVAGAEDVIRTISVIPAEQMEDRATCGHVVQKLANTVPFLSSLIIINADGFTRCEAGADNLAHFLGDKPYFVEALATHQRTTGAVAPDLRTGRMALPIARRIGDRAGELPGVVVAFIDLDWLQSRLAEKTFEPGSSLTVADRNGYIIARVPDPAEYVGTIIPDRYRYLVSEPQPGTIELTSQDSTRRVLGYYPVPASPSGLYISAGYSTALGYQSYRETSMQVILVALVGVLAVSALAFFTAQQFIVKPVQILVTTIARWRDGDRAARTGLDAKDGEICSAGQALDSLLDELETNRAARKKAEEQRALLSEELEHRVKNLLATIQAIARQTFQKGANDDAQGAFSLRLNAIGEANRALRQQNWQNASLRGLVQSSVSPFVDISGGRINAVGPDLVIQSSVVVGLTMALHELCTNALKYGSLSNEVGGVLIEWTIADGMFQLVWSEHDGPPVKAPQRSGFGSRMIKLALASQTGGEVDLSYPETGLVCRFTVAADRMIVQQDQREG